MKKILLLSLSLMAMLMSPQTLWAEREAPTLPTSLEPEIGETYCLYNPESQKFLYGETYHSGNYYVSLSDRSAYSVTLSGTLESVMMTTDDEKIIGLYNDVVSLRNSDSWIFEQKEEGYKVRSAYEVNYWANRGYLYMTAVGGTIIQGYSTCDSNYSTWQFFNANDANRYLAERKIYDALCSLDGKGYALQEYEELYANRSNASVEELNLATKRLENAIANGETIGKVLASWNEFPILLESDEPWRLSTTPTTYFSTTVPKSGSARISATFEATEDVTVIYTPYDGGSSNDIIGLKTYVDGQLFKTTTGKYIMHFSYAGRYFVELTPGVHTIELVFENGSTSSSKIMGLKEIGILQSPTISVNLLEPGSLGTEVLYNVNSIKEVRKLKVSGKMNNDDWAKINMMTSLLTLDIENTDVTIIPENQFSVRYNSSASFVHDVKLPKGLTTIKDNAFYASNVNSIELPQTIKELGKYAFISSMIENINLPNSLTKIGDGVFWQCYMLEDIIWPSNLPDIPDFTFMDAYNLNTFEFPVELKTIGTSAFSGCYKFNPRFPEGLTTIGTNNYSFSECATDSLFIPESTVNICNSAFYNNTKMVYAELPTVYYKASGSIISNCKNLNTIVLKSPTVVTNGANLGISDISKVTIKVPQFLVNSYKLDSYWYNAKAIEGFSTAEIQDWTISNPLILNHDRFEGNPTICISGSSTRFPSLKINGDAPMSINNLTFNGSYSNTYYNYPGQILNNCDNITVTGDIQTTLWSKAKYWYFYSLPFDVKVSEITHSADGVQKAVRYYDGANRAENGRTGSWKNYDADAVIPAGTGFIMQTNVDTWNYFHAVDNANKALCVSNREIVKTLDVNASENASNRGWNLVGNPWQCYYNDHMLNFTGPITVWSVGNKTYTAYSITDDDYAIAPNEAFFVQCPNAEYNTIGFPTQGRQLTNIIEQQNAAKPMMTAAAQRLLVNVKISNGENEDLTRVVLNEKASMDYELHCDAGKMMSMDTTVPQIYTLDTDGTPYAINERPMSTGLVTLGFYAGVEGVYTLSLGRCDAENVVLIDYETGTEQLLTSDYTFSAPAGYDNGRFALKFNVGQTTGIESMNSESLNDAPCYNLSGQRVMRGTKGIVIVGGRKIVNK